VTSEGVALPLMKESSAWSRCSKVIEVGDITDEEALKYLEAKNIPPHVAAEAVKTITGGRLILLTQVTDYQTDLGQWKKILTNRVKRVLQDNNIALNNGLFALLISRPYVPLAEALDYLDGKKLDALLSANVLAYHRDETYSFHARYVQAFFEQVNKQEKKVVQN
jgi:hypothetical protein